MPDDLFMVRFFRVFFMNQQTLLGHIDFFYKFMHQKMPGVWNEIIFQYLKGPAIHFITENKLKLIDHNSLG